MKKVLAFTLALAIAGTSTFAQTQREVKPQQHAQGKHHGKKHEALAGIDLTAAQKEKLKADRQAYKAKMDELNKQDNITVKEMRERKAAIQKEQKAKMEALLTPEQKSKMAANRVAMQAKHKEMQAKKAAMLKEKLNLTEAQSAKLKDRQDQTHAQLKAIRENEALSMDEKKAQSKALLETARNDRKNIFTAEQLQKMEEMKKERKHLRKNGPGKTEAVK